MIDQITAYWNTVISGALTTADILGWIGTLGLFAFYWQLAKGKVVNAYLFGIAAGVVWGAVGVLLSLPSLLFMETVIIFLNLHGIHAWRKKAVTQ